MRPGAVTLEPGSLPALLAAAPIPIPAPAEASASAEGAVSGGPEAAGSGQSPLGRARPELEVLFGEAERARHDVGRSLELATRVARRIPRPGGGETALYLETLATLAAADVTVARVVEPHVDAAMILAECPDAVDLEAIGADRESTWGVFAAEGSGVRLTATPDADGCLLEGTKPWCSLAGRLTHALVTAHVDPDLPDDASAHRGGVRVGGGRRLFAVDLRQGGVVAHEEQWVARGFPSVPSGPTDFERVRAVPVGETGWYLHRPGFEWGGIGVAACWFGGAVGVARRVVEAAVTRGDDIALLHAGRAALAIETAASALAAAARAVDARAASALASAAHALDARAAADRHAGGAGDVGVGGLGRGDGADEGAREAIGVVAHTQVGRGGEEDALLAQVARSIVRRAAEDVLREAAHALGPAPLALDADYAARVADLELYLRQDHGTRDEARVGRQLAALAATADTAPAAAPTDAAAGAGAPADPPAAATARSATSAGNGAARATGALGALGAHGSPGSTDAPADDARADDSLDATDAREGSSA
ncbi:hypothetical protein ACEXQD_18765 [Herbiconiux sp. P15]|uniref:hypothetical protein n=1 Tax=Herbiconiux liukaitaii TaxID=3342799 RepID=UPI0035BA5F1D